MAVGLAGPAAAQSTGAAQPLDRIVAIVDEDVILASELREAMDRAVSALRASGRELPPMDVLQREVFDRLVLENLQLQMAQRAGVRIADAELNDAMERIAAQNGMTLEQFSRELSADGISYAAAREQIRKEMILQRVQQGNVSQRIQVSDQEIENFLASPDGRQMLAPQYRVRHFLVEVSGEQSAAAAERIAGQLAARLQGGASLEELPESVDGYRVQGGDLGWLRAEELPSLFAELVPAMSEGQVSQPIRSPSGVHVVNVAGIRGSGEVVQQTRASHILLKPSAIRDEAATRELAAELRQRALQGEDFAELARRYSEDIGSAMEGGDLGWTTPGQLVEAFEAAMAQTEKNAISEPFQTRYGWHIVKVIDRRNQDVTDTLRRNMARNYLHQRKFQDELQAWLRKIRDEAYVDIKQS
jgi:peptidyl-prolyl cis-trans isomerase SurA